MFKISKNISSFSSIGLQRINLKKIQKQVSSHSFKRAYGTISKPSFLNNAAPPQKSENPFSRIHSMQFEKQPSLENPLLPDFDAAVVKETVSGVKKVNPKPGSDLFNVTVPVVHPVYSDIKKTTLANGVVVATVENHSNISSVSITFDKAGTKMDPVPGYAILSNKLTFANLSSKNDEIDELYCDAMVDTNSKLFFISVERDSFIQRFRTLCNQVVSPNFSQGEVDEVVENINQTIDEEYNNPATSQVFEDAIRKACFGPHQANGQPVLTKINEQVSNEDLKTYIKQIQRPENCAVVGLGVDHETLVQAVEKFLVFEPNLPEVKPLFDQKKNDWAGGEVFHEFTGHALDLYKQNIPTLQSFALAFHGTEDKASELAVLESILGGGASFSAGGPGKGLMSIIHTDILSRFPVNFALASVMDNSIFTIRVGATSEYAQYIAMAVVELCATLMERITEEDLERGKRRLKFSALSTMENPRILTGYLSSNLLDESPEIRNQPGIQHVLERIDKVTLNDIRKVWKELASQPFAMAAVGDNANFPSYAGMERVFTKIREFNDRYQL